MSNERPWLLGVLALLLLALALRLAIIEWGLPYPANPAHEHGLFYDSRAVVRDQYRALYALYHFPAGLITEAVASYMPLGQRYLAAPALAAWFWLDGTTNPEAVQAAGFAQHASKTLLVNRLLSILANVASAGLLYLIARRMAIGRAMSLLLVGLLVVNPLSLGLSIHAKTITAVTLVLALEWLCLLQWLRRRTKPRAGWRWLLLAAFLVGVSAATREQAPYFAALLWLIALLWVARRAVWRELAGWRWLAYALAPVLGLALTSPDFLVKWYFWVSLAVQPHRDWVVPGVGVLAEFWYLFELLFAGSVGVLILLGSVGWLARRFPQLSQATQILVLWLPSFIVLLLIYPQRSPRFVEPVLYFGLVLIGLALPALVARWPRLGRLVVVGWLGQSLFWGMSTLQFFAGGDARLEAANEWHAQATPGTSVGTFLRPRHSRQIPLDETQFTLYAVDNDNSTPATIAWSKGGVEVPGGITGVWPDEILIQREVGAVAPTLEVLARQRWRQQIIDSGQYQLVQVHPKRQRAGWWQGLYSTRSRWAYLNPEVEVWRRTP